MSYPAKGANLAPANSCQEWSRVVFINRAYPEKALNINLVDIDNGGITTENEHKLQLRGLLC
jgi:disulfide oxidoreductase YuzD